MATSSSREALPPGTPISLPVEALEGERPRSAPTPIPVEAWVPLAGGYLGEFARARALAIAWTSRAVELRWRRADKPEWQGWVWANAVRRAETLMQGPPATHRPGLIAHRGPR
jgi:hypothetical protein